MKKQSTETKKEISNDEELIKILSSKVTVILANYLSKLDENYSLEEKRKIILDNYSHPDKQLEFEELNKLSNNWRVPFLTVRSLDNGCGDILHLLIVKKDNCIEKCLFSGQQSCLITIAAANILCSSLEEKDLEFAQKILENCESMIEKKKYNLEDCPDLQAFSDISQFSHRIECIKLVVRGLAKLLI